METSLHRQLKERYAVEGAEQEVRLGDYRIDVVSGDQLVEIQHGSLSAIRDKVQRLLKKHEVLVVKPIIAGKCLVRCDGRGGKELGRRRSPKRGTILDLFDELVYFTRVFPHKRLTLEVPLVSVEERRFPGHGRRRRRRANDYQVEDVRLVEVQETHRFQSAADLARLIPAGLPATFHTGDLADVLDLPRSSAQQIAYCFRNMGVARQVGKQGNALMYRLTSKAKRKAA